MSKNEEIILGILTKENEDEKKKEIKSQQKAHEIKKLSDLLSVEIQKVLNLENQANEATIKIVKLRKNLYGILNSGEPPESLVGLIERQDRRMVEQVYRRYARLTIDDFADVAQIKQAKQLYQQDGKVEIDADAIISYDAEDNSGLWVQSWVYIYGR